ncbi:hypothetical protein HDV01_004104 [Terramyces sp. JEL0728]|nr:hypothetical protein HDV01_004104 [Terramyces sp. JEL0728]
MVPKVLTVAGSDSGGGAGIQADLKTFTALSVYSSSVITCVTSQNTQTVDAIQVMPAEFVEAQLRAVLTDIGADVIKFGMLFSSEIIDTVVNYLVHFYGDNMPRIVLDPVMVATSGAMLLNPEAVHDMKTKVLPITYLVTPNVPEAIILADEDDSMKDLNDLKRIARKIADYGSQIVLLKGGHVPFDINGNTISIEATLDPLNQDESYYLIDLVYSKVDDEFFELKNKFVKTKNNHGTGCTVSAAIAANLAKGLSPREAIVQAVEFVQIAIQTSFDIGFGNGPLNHFHSTSHVAVPPSTNDNPYPFSSIIRLRFASLWYEYTHHPFVQGLQDGTLPPECFAHYLKQDYLFLLHFARANSLGAYKCTTFEEMAAFNATAMNIVQESKLHEEYCLEWGISLEELKSTEECTETIAYTRYVIDKGNCGTLLELRTAMAPCVMGYGDIGLRLYNDPATVREGNPYWKWICMYADENYQRAVESFQDALERDAANLKLDAESLETVLNTAKKAILLEISFWEMGLKP